MASDVAKMKRGSPDLWLHTCKIINSQAHIHGCRYVCCYSADAASVRNYLVIFWCVSAFSFVHFLQWHELLPHVLHFPVCRHCLCRLVRINQARMGLLHAEDAIFIDIHENDESSVDKLAFQDRHTR